MIEKKNRSVSVQLALHLVTSTVWRPFNFDVKFLSIELQHEEVFPSLWNLLYSLNMSESFRLSVLSKVCVSSSTVTLPPWNVRNKRLDIFLLTSSFSKTSPLSFDECERETMRVKIVRLLSDVGFSSSCSHVRGRVCMLCMQRLFRSQLKVGCVGLKINFCDLPQTNRCT